MNGNGRKSELQLQVMLLYAVAMRQPVTTKELCQVLDISRMTLHRQFAALKANFDVQIRFETQKTSERGRHGAYKIESWGVFQKEAFLTHIKRSVDRILSE